MSVASQISRIKQNVIDSLAAVEDKGVTVPAGSNSDDLPGLIAQIVGGGVIIDDTEDENGGIIRTITAANVIKTQGKTHITPTESDQTIVPDEGYSALTSVQIDAIPSSYVQPAGNLAITENGTGINVAQYATVSVDIQTEEGGMVITEQANATGTTAVITGDEITLTAKTITQNGTYNASSDNADGYSSVTVNVSGGSSPSATQHSIYFEFSDSTNTTIPVYYNDTLLSTMITAYKPTTYGGKTVTLAQLDGVTWYEPANIPIGVELIDYSKVTADTIINSQGQAETMQWYFASDYTPVDSGMTFTYTASYWHYVGVYDENKTVIRTIYVYQDGTVDPDDGNVGHGTLSGNELTGAKYVRICSTHQSSPGMSLIRTA